MYSGQPVQFSVPPITGFGKAAPFSTFGTLQNHAPAFPSMPSVRQAPTDAHLGQSCKEFSYKALSKATSDFGSLNVLGTGSFGSVYRGLLEDDTGIAVKVISKPSQSGFEDEVKILSKYRHPNLVMLLGFARNGVQRLLVYECMDKGDCEKRLKSPTLSISFKWEQRLSVLLDACRGISYLHNSVPIVFHRDIKPSNILVDKNWVGKMADFGLSCELSSSGQTSMKVKNSAGTIGYACPSYVQSGVVTEATEVYSFGICILEFLTNKPPASNIPLLPGQVSYLVDSLQGRISSLLNLLDINAGWPETLAVQLGELTFECTHRLPTRRPRMVSVVQRLKALHSGGSEAVMQPPPSLSPAKQFSAALPSMACVPNHFQAFQSLMCTARAEIPKLPLLKEEGNTPYLDCRALSNLSDSKPLKLDFANDADFVVGRNRQAALFDSLCTFPYPALVRQILVPSETLRLCVSRDHFLIRKDGPKFFLINLSGNGTVIEHKRFLEKKNELHELKDGDVIKLVQTSIAGVQSPFLIMQFRALN